MAVAVAVVPEAAAAVAAAVVVAAAAVVVVVVPPPAMMVCPMGWTVWWMGGYCAATLALPFKKSP